VKRLKAPYNLLETIKGGYLEVGKDALGTSQWLRVDFPVFYLQYICAAMVVQWWGLEKGKVVG
jgi:hypothetical protein